MIVSHETKVTQIPAVRHAAYSCGQEKFTCK